MSKVELSLTDIPFPDTTTIERQFLYDCVNNSESMPDFTSIVDESMFTNEARLYLWRTILWMFNNGQVIDLATVVTRTGRFFKDEIVMQRLELSTPFASLQHAMALRAAAVKRRAYHSAVNLLQSVTRPTTGELEVFDAAQQILSDIQGDTPIISETPMADVMNIVTETVNENKANTESGKRTRIPTGFNYLDGLTYQGWGPGQLIILAARPSIGKTAIMLQMAKSAARSGFPATIFSLEMTKEELGNRLLFSTGHITPVELATGRVDEGRFKAAKDEIKSLPLYINDESRTLASIISRITVSVARGHCGVAFIDYLGLITIDESGRTPLYQQIAKATRELKLVAKRQKIPIVLLCQLNRDAAKDDGSPQLYHLRDSGSIEQDADIVLMLEQIKTEVITSEGETIPGKPDINIWVRKNRQFQKDIKIVVKPNDTYSAFSELRAENAGVPTTQPVPQPEPQPAPVQQENNEEDLPF